MTYYKIIDGVTVYSDCRTIQMPNGKWVSNPTALQIRIAGWSVYERTLDDAKRERINALMDYDSSSAVNEFYLNSQGMWIAPDERSNYMLTLQGANRLGLTEVSFLGQTISIGTAMQMIDAVNLYAMQCVAVTEHHKDVISNLNTIQDVDNYDFTIGYPTKLVF